MDETVPLSFEEAFDGCYRAAYRVAFKVLGSPGDAEDLAQESMTRAYLKWKTIRGYAEAWVCRVCLNLALDMVRKRRRAAPVDPAPRAEDAVTAERMDLANALARLPRRQREVVGLRFLADRSEVEVARALGCSVGSVKQHAHRGLETLRAAVIVELAV